MRADVCEDDAPAHLAEEMKEASKQGPRTIVLSVYVGAVTGFIFLIAICFCKCDINAVAYTTTNIPLIQIYFGSTNSLVGSCFLATLIVIIDVACANALLAEGSRSLYAFAHDRGLPFPSVLVRLRGSTRYPLSLSYLVRFANGF